VTKAKPDPAVFLMATKGLGLPPETCVVFEDAKVGVQAVKAAGMKCVAIGDSEILSQADYCFKTTAAIPLNLIQTLVYSYE
jgi:beta-phosphoglucomutase